MLSRIQYLIHLFQYEEHQIKNLQIFFNYIISTINMNKNVLNTKRENFRVEIRNHQVEEFLKNKRLTGYLEVIDEQHIQNQVCLVYQDEEIKFEHLNFLVRFHQQQSQNINQIIQIIYFYNTLIYECNSRCIEELEKTFGVIDFLIEKLYNTDGYNQKLYLGIVDTLSIIAQKNLEYQYYILCKIVQPLIVNLGKYEIKDEEFFLQVLNYLYYNYKSRIAFSQIKNSIELLNKISKYFTSTALIQQPQMMMEDCTISKRQEDVLYLIVTCLKYYIDKSYNQYNFIQDKGIFLVIKNVCLEQYSKRVLQITLNVLSNLVSNNKNMIMSIQEKLDLINVFGKNLDLNVSQEPQTMKIRIHCLQGIGALFESDLVLIDQLKETKMYELVVQLCQMEFNQTALYKELQIIRKFLKNDKFTLDIIPITVKLLHESLKDLDLNRRQVMHQCLRILSFFLKQRNQEYVQIMTNLDLKNILEYIFLNVKTKLSQEKSQLLLLYFEID
ncbi:hypothetical protein pb186bvf_015623 [Paramecium bursaria]